MTAAADERRRATYAFAEAGSLDQGQDGRVAGDLAGADADLAADAGVHLGEDDGVDVGDLQGHHGGGARGVGGGVVAGLDLADLGGRDLALGRAGLAGRRAEGLGQAGGGGLLCEQSMLDI